MGQELCPLSPCFCEEAVCDGELAFVWFLIKPACYTNIGKLDTIYKERNEEMKMTCGLPPKGNTVNTSECIFHVTFGLFPSLVLMRISLTPES